MRIGLSYDLKEDINPAGNLPDDALEEYDYPATIEYISRALEAEGNIVIKLGGGRKFLENILKEKVDIVFNIAEGRGTFRSREAQVPSVLEMLNIPYVGSDPATLAICLDKPLTKKLVSFAGVPTPRWYTITHKQELVKLSSRELNFPLIVKPSFEGSSKGVKLNSVVRSFDQLSKVTCDILEKYHQPVMIEEFIAGDEITVGIVGNYPPEIVGIMKILPVNNTEHFVYSVEVKRDWKNLVKYECPASISDRILEKLTEESLKIFSTLECRDFSRIDFRLGKDGTPYFIEINPLPGLGDYSDLVIMATKMGCTHEGLIQKIFKAGRERYNL